MENIPWSRLTPDQRRELEEILRTQPNDRFLSDYGDSSAWWLMAILLGVAGAIGAGTQIGNPLELWRLVPYMIEHGIRSGRALLFPAAFVISVAVAAWAAYTWATNHRRRGYAVTSFATIRVKGHRLVLIRHAAVARMEWTQHAPPGSQRFSVLVLSNADGGKMTCYVHAGWVRTAIAQIDRGRAEAKLPPLEGDARKLPDPVK